MDDVGTARLKVGGHILCLIGRLAARIAILLAAACARCRCVFGVLWYCEFFGIKSGVITLVAGCRD